MTPGEMEDAYWARFPGTRGRLVAAWLADDDPAVVAAPDDWTRRGLTLGELAEAILRGASVAHARVAELRELIEAVCGVPVERVDELQEEMRRVVEGRVVRNDVTRSGGWHDVAEWVRQNVDAERSSVGVVELVGGEVQSAVCLGLYVACALSVSSAFIRGGLFDDANFVGYARFSTSHFREDARFARVIFGSHARFNRVNFVAQASFHRTEFSKSAWFARARFHVSALFHWTTFAEQVDFNSATFCGETWFYRVRFDRLARFAETRFSGSVWFNGVSFESSVWFSHALFDAYVDFHDTSFGLEAAFENALFDRGLWGDFRLCDVRSARVYEGRWGWRRFVRRVLNPWVGVSRVGRLRFLAGTSLAGVLVVPLPASGWAVLHEVLAGVSVPEEGGGWWAVVVRFLKAYVEPEALPLTLVLVFLAAACVALGQLVYQLFCPGRVQERDEDAFVAWFLERYKGDGIDRDDGLRRACDALKDRSRRFGWVGADANLVRHHGDVVWVPGSDSLAWYEDVDFGAKLRALEARSESEALIEPVSEEEWADARREAERRPDGYVSGGERARVAMEEGARAEYWLMAREGVFAGFAGFVLYFVGLGLLLWVLGLQAMYVLEAARVSLWWLWGAVIAGGLWAVAALVAWVVGVAREG